MQRGRKPVLSQKSLAFLRAQMAPPQLASHPPRSPLRTLLERIRSAVGFGSLIGLVLLILSAPIVLVLFFVTPWNLTVLWLTIGAILGGVIFLGLLPEIAASSPWKAAGLGVVAVLVGLAPYLWRTAALPTTLIYTPLLLAYAILYAWQGATYLQAYQQQRHHLLACVLASTLTIACVLLPDGRSSKA